MGIRLQQPTLEGVLEVAGRQVIAVVEFDPFADLEKEKRTIPSGIVTKRGIAAKKASPLCPYHKECAKQSLYHLL
jgi:hypothetical protein